MFSNDEIIYAALTMDPRDAEPESVETITENQLLYHTGNDVFYDVFWEVYGRRFNYRKDGRALLSKTPVEFDSWVSDLYYKANAYSKSSQHAPMLPHMVEKYEYMGFVWGTGSWTGEEASFRDDNPYI